MRAVICREWCDPSGLRVEDVPAPPLAAGSVRIAVRTAGLNFADTLIIAGTYQIKPPLPFSPGFEVAGRVLECAAGVTRCKPGDRVMAVIEYGGFAEQVVAPEDCVFVLPDTVDDMIAAAFPVAYGTSHLGLKYKAGLVAGETLLVHGAAGGVGLTAVEIGKRLGARVIAVASGAEKLRVCADAGADHVVDSRADDLRNRIKELTGGRGVDRLRSGWRPSVRSLAAYDGVGRTHPHRRFRLRRSPADPGQCSAGQEYLGDRLLLGCTPDVGAAPDAGILRGTAAMARSRIAAAARLADLPAGRGDAGAAGASSSPHDRQAGAYRPGPIVIGW
jgi:Zinc-binding dehydrogenase/Alcohol dehydrogenase GroES-like domain